MPIRICALFFIMAGLAFAAAAEPAQSVYFLRKLLIADTDIKAAALPADAGGEISVFVQDVPLLSDASFTKKIAPFIGKPISNELLNSVAKVIADHARSKDRLIVKVMPPNQDVSNGIFRLGVVVGTYNQFQFRGNRWFSSKLLQEKLGIKAGDEVRLSTLDEAVKWANTNPFRQIEVLINDLPNQPGKADLIVGVNERIPVRFTASYDDSGNAILGRPHYTGALQFGNLWGLDHQGSYQFTTTDHQSVFKSHSVDYRLPLPWRHHLQFSGGYLKVKPTFEGGAFVLDGKNLIASLRYALPIRDGDNPVDFSTGADFKRGNNTLAFGGRTASATDTDTVQWTTAFSAIHRDKFGAWLVAYSLSASPGNVTRRNTDAALSTRKPTSSSYVTQTFSAQRSLDIGRGWNLSSRATVKVASHTLPGTEQFSVGGASTARGFDEQLNTGDQGFVMNHDLQTPSHKAKLPFGGRGRPALETRLVAFYDYAEVSYKNPDANDVVLRPLASWGLGVRMILPNNFTLSSDYGWPITALPLARDRKAPPVVPSSRGHIKVVLAF